MICVSRRCRPCLIAAFISVAFLNIGKLALAVPAPDTLVRFDTTLGNIDVELFNSAAPITVQNFLSYVTANDYNNMFFHRLVNGFVLQGGGFTYNSGTGLYNPVPAGASIVNEFSASRSNLAGTIAMAKTSSGPDTATNQFFFNLADNSSNLDNQNGGFTVFGQVVGNGMSVVNQLAGAAPNAAHVGVWDASSFFQSQDFTTLPLINFPNNTSLNPYLEMVSSVTVLHTWNSTAGGSWNTGANWLSGVSPDGNSVTALFGNQLVGPGVVDLGTTPRTVHSLDFASGSNLGAYTLTGAATGVLTLNGGVGSATIQLDDTNSVDQTITAPISFATPTTIRNRSTGGALLVLGGIQNWNGSTVTVAAGGVKFNNATTGTVSSGAALSIANGASVELAGGSSATTGVAVKNEGAFSVTGTNQHVAAISGGGTTTVGAGASLSADAIGQTSLAIGVVGGAAASVTINATSPSSFGTPGDGTVPKGNSSGTSVLTSLSIAKDENGTYYGTLDLQNNNLVINYSGSSPLDAIRDAIHSAYAAGAWDGKGLTSSLFGQQGTAAIALGYGENNDPNSFLAFDHGANPFDGTPVNAQSVLVKFTWQDDLNLDGVVDITDAAAFGNSYDGGATNGHSFAQGDLNYDGFIDASDAQIFRDAYSTSLAQLPEPSSFLLGGLGLLGLLFVRRRLALVKIAK